MFTTSTPGLFLFLKQWKWKLLPNADILFSDETFSSLKGHDSDALYVLIFSLINCSHLLPWCCSTKSENLGKLLFNLNGTRGSGCGSVGRALPYNTRGPQFETSNRKLYITLILSTVLKRRKLRKIDREWPNLTIRKGTIFIYVGIDVKFYTLKSEKINMIISSIIISRLLSKMTLAKLA